MSNSLRPHELQHARPPCPLREEFINMENVRGVKMLESHWLGQASCPFLLPLLVRHPQVKRKSIKVQSVSLVAQMVSECKNLLAVQEAWVQALGWEGHLRSGNPLQYSCLENATDRGAWWVTAQGITKSQTRLSKLSFLSVSFSFKILF